MENLETSLEKVPVHTRIVEVKPENKGLYKGLKLVEEREYQGPTGVRYWM